MSNDDLAALHERALRVEAELDGATRNNDRLRLALGSPPPGQQSALIATTLAVVLSVVAVIYVATSVSTHRRVVAETTRSAGGL
jgi:hypothetical protein